MVIAGLCASIILYMLPLTASIDIEMFVLFLSSRRIEIGCVTVTLIGYFVKINTINYNVSEGK
jgi:hypothetical protein